jgi:hypothetical protein
MAPRIAAGATEGRIGRAETTGIASAMLSLVLAVGGVVLSIEGGPHPRTRAAWLAGAHDRRDGTRVSPAQYSDALSFGVPKSSL